MNPTLKHLILNLFLYSAVAVSSGYISYQIGKSDSTKEKQTITVEVSYKDMTCIYSQPYEKAMLKTERRLKTK